MKRLRRLLALGLLASALMASSTACATGAVRLGKDPAAPVAQLETAKRLVCEDRDADLAAYFAALGTPEPRRIEIAAEARDWKAQGKCLCAAGCKPEGESR